MREAIQVLMESPFWYRMNPRQRLGCVREYLGQ